MTESPMEGNAGSHLDEGTIHAWLDDALDAATAERVAQHARSCSECSERVAEARGLIAGASRIIGALDDVPAGTRAGWGRAATVSTGELASPPMPASADPSGSSLWRWLRVTPARAAIAAALVVAVGITLTHERGVLNGPEATIRPATVATASAPAAPVQDHLLDSAVARNLANARPERTVEAATTPAMPVPPAAEPALEAVDTQAGARVALGRQAVRAQRETTNAVAADRSRVGVAKALARKEIAGAVAAVAQTESDARVASAAAGNAPSNERNGAVLTCYRVESSTPNARWALQPLPLVVALDTNRYAGGRQARLFSPSGARLPMSASWSRTPADSLSIALRFIGWTGTIAAGPESPVRVGVASSGQQSNALEEVVVTGYGASSHSGIGGTRTQADSAPPSSPSGTASAAAAPSAAPASRAFAKRADAAVPAAQQLPVTLRPTACPAF